VSDLERSARAWVAEVEAAYADGGYAAGDGPRPPLDEMAWLLAERDHLRAALQRIADDPDGFDWDHPVVASDALARASHKGVAP
jgi:hypothetical protein